MVFDLYIYSMKTNITKIRNILELMGTCVIEFNSTSRDFTYNRIEPKKVNQNFFKDKKENFYKLLGLQLSKGKIDENLFKILIDLIDDNLHSIQIAHDNHRVAFLRTENKAAESRSTHLTIVEIVKIQINVLNEIRGYLLDLSKNLNYLIEDDINHLVTSNETDKGDVIKAPPLGKLVFKLNKKDSANLITLLEYLDFIDFNSTSRNQFIEANFQYWSKTNVPADISKVNSDIANLHDIKGELGQRNSKSMSKLVQNLIKKLESVKYKEYAEWLKTKI